MRLILPLIVLGVALLSSPAAPAGAEENAQVTALCSAAPAGCSLRFDPWLREGATYPVVVQGTPGARVQVVVYAATFVQGRVASLTPVSTGGDVLLPGSGIADARVVIPPLRDGLSGGWALVSLAGVAGTDPSNTIGGFVPLGSRVPTVLGDGYGKRKPAGAALELHLTGTIPGSSYAVEHLDDQGVWQDVTVEPSIEDDPAARPDQVVKVRYQVPRGLSATEQTFRLRNLTSGTAEVTWSAVPDTSGVEQPRAPLFDAPSGWERPDAARAASAHPVGAVRAVAAGIGVIAAVAVLVGIPLAARRGSLDA